QDVAVFYRSHSQSRALEETFRRQKIPYRIVGGVGFYERREIKDALEDLREPVKGVIATWKHPYAKWNPADEQTHEAFRRDLVVMGMVQDGRVIFANQADRQRLMKNAGK
ncbi:MAG: hypothetical protein B7Z46_00860, partial [Hydrogenophilales bacterium 12-64-6]